MTDPRENAEVPIGQTQSAPKTSGAVKSAGFQHLNEFLRFFYSGKRKRLKLKRKEEKSIEKELSTRKADPQEQDALLALAAGDRTLVRTRDLLLYLGDVNAPTLRGQIRFYAREAMRRHPAFKHESLAGVLENLPHALGDDEAVRTISSIDYASIVWPEGSSRLQKKELEQCRVNAVHCLLIWFNETRGMPLDSIRRHLSETLWIPAAKRFKTEHSKLGILLNSRDPGALAIACSSLEKQAAGAQILAEAAKNAETRAGHRASELELKLIAAENSLETARGEITRLSDTINTVKSDHENQKAHLRDEYEELRGRVLRRLREEVSLLDEGLQALRRNPPKVHVMLDHAERAIDGLKREIERIQQEL